MGQIDFSPLWVTLKTGIVASVFSFFIGIACHKHKGQSEGILGWTADTSYGTAAYRGWIHSFKDFQHKASFWKLFKP